MLEEIGGTIAEEVLDKPQVEDSKREAYRGKGSPLEWRRARRSKTNRMRKWEKDCWARFFVLFKEYKFAVCEKQA